MPLDVLTEQESRALLTRRLGVHRATAEPEATSDLIRSCGGFPGAGHRGRPRPDPTRDLPDGEANAWDTMGYLAHRTGRHHEAVDCYRRALSLLGDLGHTYQVAAIRDRLGDPHAALACTTRPATCGRRRCGCTGRSTTTRPGTASSDSSTPWATWRGAEAVVMTGALTGPEEERNVLHGTGHGNVVRSGSISSGCRAR